MSTPELSTIISAIVTGLGGMTVAGGYNFTPGVCSAELQLPEEVASLTTTAPALFVLDGPESYDDEFGGYVRSRTTLHIFGYVRHATIPRTQCRLLRQDVFKWLAKNPAPGGCDLARVNRAETGEDVFAPLGFGVQVVRPLAVFRMDVEVGYQFLLATGG